MARIVLRKGVLRRPAAGNRTGRAQHNARPVGLEVNQVEARRREHEEREREGRLQPVERERPEYGAAPLHSLVDWSSVWAGTIGAFASLAILSVLVIAVGFAAGGGTTSIVWGIIVTLIAFLAGGYVAGMVSAYRGRQEGFILGSMVWALGTAFALGLVLLGTGGLFAMLLGGAAPIGVNVQPLAVGILVALIVAYVSSVVGAMIGIGSRQPAAR